MTDEELARAALDRAVAEHERRIPRVRCEKTGAMLPHAPLEVGVAGPHPAGGVFVVMLVRRPCRSGQPLAEASFRGATLDRAYRQATRFVEAVTPPDADDEE